MSFKSQFGRVPLRCLLVLLIVAGSAVATSAKDAYYQVGVRQLKFTDGSLPIKNSRPILGRELYAILAMRPYAALDGAGEVFVIGGGKPTDTWYSPYMAFSPSPNTGMPSETRVLIRAPEGRDVHGHLFVPKADLSGMVSLRFTIPASAADAEAKKAFYNGQMLYYYGLIRRRIPGSAWFRHEMRSARIELGLPPDGEPEEGVRFAWEGAPRVVPADTFELFSGGRALSENLQLDRTLPAPRPGDKPVKLDSIAGITVQEIDWKPLLKDSQPKLDPLAARIPADQHAVFFSTFQAALAVADESKQHNGLVLQMAQPEVINARVAEQYQQQLGLPIGALARLLGPKLAKSVALTGSDPYFPTGTDLAVLFESPEPATLEKLLLGRIALSAAGTPGAKSLHGDAAGLAYRGFVSPDRRVSSYVARIEGTVIVTNSLGQLERLVAVGVGKTKSIAQLPEYAFFRTRYALGDPKETALVFVSDATIRRWCGPRWRIADSRRIRVRAVLAELQASQLDTLVKKTVQPGPIHTDLPIAGGEVRLTASGVVSPLYGSLDFMTPIAELPVDDVTQAEANAYGAWRDGYQRNWSWAFDPIALRIELGQKQLGADLTVMPIIVGTEYREFLSISEGGRFGPTVGDPHDALAHLVLAINKQSPTLQFAQNFLAVPGHAISLGWIGSAVSLYAEDDPFWTDLAKAGNDQYDKFFEKNLGRLPVALRVEVANPLTLAAFLAGIRAYVEQSGPGLTRWEAFKYKDQPLVRISPVKGGHEMPPEIENMAVYYTTAGNALTVTLSEKVLHRAIDRALAQAATAPAGKPAGETPWPWLGSNVALRVDGKVFEMANSLGGGQYETAMQAQCWGNLPILNLWKQLYPSRNPVDVHREAWGIELACPGGGKYVWNEMYRTMESTVYGSPAAPKHGPPAPPVMVGLSSADFGLTFENHGLRARVEFVRHAEKP